MNIQELTPSAREVHSHLVPYALTDTKVLCLWPGKPLDQSHRHPSQLMAIHPAMELTIDGDEETGRSSSPAWTNSSRSVNTVGLDIPTPR